MAKNDTYTARAAFADVDREGHEVHITRETEHLIPLWLTPERIDVLVKSGLIDRVPGTEPAGTPAPRRAGKE